MDLPRGDLRPSNVNYPFKNQAEALAIPNDTEYLLIRTGVWTRSINRARRIGRGIQVSRVWIK